MNSERLAEAEMIAAGEESSNAWMMCRVDREALGKKSLRQRDERRLHRRNAKGEARRRRTRSGVSATDPVPGGSGWLAVFSLAIGRPLVASSNCMPAAALSVTCCTRCALFASVGRPWLAFLLQAVAFSIGCATVVNEKHNTLNGGKNIWQANQSSHTD